MKTCTYDPLYRLLIATGKEKGLWQDTIPRQEWDTTAPNNVTRGYVEEYEYDKVGFMTSLNHRAANNSYQYTRSFASSGANHLASMTSGSNTFAFSYDESGNLTSGNGNHYYEWDYRNQLQRFYVAASSSGTKSVDAYYLYDGAGNRTKKFVLNQAGTEADITVYIGAMEVRYKKVVVNSDISSTYTDLTATIKIEEGGQCVATFQSGDHPDEFNVDYFTYSDHLGSSTLLIKTNGEIISREFYTPFGETAYRTSPKSRYRYCGKEKDGESGLYYYGARYYAAWLCRFVSVDPMAEKYAGLSAYCYCFNSPINLTDPDGRDPAPDKGTGGETRNPVAGVAPGSSPVVTGVVKPEIEIVAPRLPRLEFQGNSKWQDNKSPFSNILFSPPGTKFIGPLGSRPPASLWNMTHPKSKWGHLPTQEGGVYGYASGSKNVQPITNIYGRNKHVVDNTSDGYAKPNLGGVPESGITSFFDFIASSLALAAELWNWEPKPEYGDKELSTTSSSDTLKIEKPTPYVIKQAHILREDGKQLTVEIHGKDTSYAVSHGVPAIIYKRPSPFPVSRQDTIRAREKGINFSIYTK